MSYKVESVILDHSVTLFLSRIEDWAKQYVVHTKTLQRFFLFPGLRIAIQVAHPGSGSFFYLYLC